LAYFLANSPSDMLKIFDSVAFEVILSMYPEYDNIQNEIFVRITDLPISYTLRDLRRTALNALIRVSGVITRRTGVFPQLKYVKYNCQKCGAILGPFYQDTSNEIRVSNCSGCQSKGPFIVNSEQVCAIGSPFFVKKVITCTLRPSTEITSDLRCKNLQEVSLQEDCLVTRRLFFKRIW
jgi:DNA replicative helicase MCM subunit Mcm2 (Cdc46/Mcm family)